MQATQREPWYEARKAPFEAFGILYYPLFTRRNVFAGTELDDVDMTWAVTANTNLEGTGYTLSQPSILSLAAYHHHMATLWASAEFLPLAKGMEGAGINPLADIQRLVPNVTATPMYPDFPSQVMEMDEATFRYHQARHYASTYGVELVAGLLGLDVEVGEGWRPSVTATPKTREDTTLVPPKVLHLVLTVEDLRSVVNARLSRATRMHPAELESTLLVFEDLDEDQEAGFSKVAFHENMMELIRVAAQGSSTTLARVAGTLAQHPGDLLKATMYLLQTGEKGHLLTRQKKGLCRAFEQFSANSIAHNIADAGKKVRRAPNYLSVERFAGPHLREGCELVWSGEVVSWAAHTEQLWNAVQEAEAPEPAWRALLAHYGSRPGMLLRSLARLVQGGCPFELLEPETMAHVEHYALPTLVRTLTIMSETAPHYRLQQTGFATQQVEESEGKQFDGCLCELLCALVCARLRELKTPLAGKRVYLDTAGVSLAGSILMPNDNGNTGTAWPPTGIAFDLPADQTVRFFTFWDDRSRRVDVDLHFAGIRTDGTRLNIGWNAGYQGAGLVTSGDITTSHDSVEYLDAHMSTACEEGLFLVMQTQHIYSGASNWGDIDTCYSGALVVGDRRNDAELYQAKNLLFRDDLTGSGRRLAYAVVNFSGHYVRIIRGANLPAGDVGFSLGDYLAALFEAQDVALVTTPAEADVCVCVGRSEDPEVVSLFDEGFFL